MLTTTKERLSLGIWAFVYLLLYVALGIAGLMVAVNTVKIICYVAAIYCVMVSISCLIKARKGLDD